MILLLQSWNVEKFQRLERRKLMLQLFNLKTFSPFFIFLFALLSLLFTHFGFYILNSQFEQYWFFNWTLNTVFDDKFSVLRTLSETSWIYYGFIVALLVSITISSYGLIQHRLKSQNVKPIILLFSLFFFIFSLLFIVRSPYTQYFLPISIFGSILIAIYLEKVYEQKEYFGVGVFIIFLIFPIFTYKEFSIQNYTFDRQYSDIARDNLLTNEERKDLPVQQSNILYDTKEFYWFSEEAQMTILQLEK